MKLPEKLKSLRPKTVLTIYAVLILVFYIRIFQTYFQSDEWHFFQVFLPYTHSWIDVIRSGIDVVIQPQKFTIPHATPLSIILWTASMKLFGLHVTPHFILSLGIHILNSYLLYVLTLRLTHRNAVSFLAGLFFALSANQYQSVVWIGTYLITSVAVTWTLLALISLIEHLQNKRKLIYYMIFTVAALLTKESTLLIIPIALILIAITHRTKITKKDWRFFINLPVLRFLVIFSLVYLPARIAVVTLFENHLIKAPTLDAADPAFAPTLVLFRLATYPIKILAQLFIAYPIVPPIVEFFTPLAYPIYGAEKTVRGTTFLLFTQSAGIDLLIYPIAAVMLVFLFFLLKRGQDPLKQTLILSLAIIIFASWPLMMVASFAPAAAYVAFFDSRHLYLPAIGGGLLFAYSASFLYHHILRKYFSRFAGMIATILLMVWGAGQWMALQSSIKPYAASGRDRRELTSVIMQEVNKQEKSGLFYIKSDSVYYGYGDLMPPFETNFGQVLTVYLNQAGLLPNTFLDTKYLLSKGLNGQGAQLKDGYQFGYFISLNKLIEALEKYQLPPDAVYAFEWKGTEHSARVVTDEIRQQITEKMKDRARYVSWRSHTIPDLDFSLKLPPTASITRQPDKNNQNTLAIYIVQTSKTTYEFSFLKRVYHLGIFEDVSLMQNADQEMIGEDYYYRTIAMKDSTSTIAKIPSKGAHLMYFLPALAPEIIIQIDVKSQSPLNANTGDEELEEIISLMRYGKNE